MKRTIEDLAQTREEKSTAEILWPTARASVQDEVRIYHSHARSRKGEVITGCTECRQEKHQVSLVWLYNYTQPRDVLPIFHLDRVFTQIPRGAFALFFC